MKLEELIKQVNNLEGMLKDYKKAILTIRNEKSFNEENISSDKRESVQNLLLLYKNAKKELKQMYSNNYELSNHIRHSQMK